MSVMSGCWGSTGRARLRGGRFVVLCSSDAEAAAVHVYEQEALRLLTTDLLRPVSSGAAHTPLPAQAMPSRVAESVMM